MAKMVVLSCEVCGVIDSVENRVATVGIAGHRVELCVKDRVGALISVGVPPEHAEAYVLVYDQKRTGAGMPPSMAQVLEMLEAGELNVEGGVPAAEPAAEELVLVGPAEETEVEAGPAKKRR